MPATPESHVRDVYDNLAERGYSDSVPSTPETSNAIGLDGMEIHHRRPHNRRLSISDALGPSKRSRGGLTPQRIGRAIATRVMRAVRRGNLPFLIIFLTALFVFFGALAGVGYVDPDAHKVRPSTDPDFVVGGPVYDPSEAQRLREARMAEQRELELKWVKKQRPNNGAWMKQSRNDGAVRNRDAVPIDYEAMQPPTDDGFVHEDEPEVVDSHSTEFDSDLGNNDPFSHYDQDDAAQAAAPLVDSEASGTDPIAAPDAGDNYLSETDNNAEVESTDDSDSNTNTDSDPKMAKEDLASNDPFSNLGSDDDSGTGAGDGAELDASAELDAGAEHDAGAEFDAGAELDVGAGLGAGAGSGLGSSSEDVGDTDPVFDQNARRIVDADAVDAV